MARFWPGDRAVKLGYDAAGRLASWQFDAETSTAAYDAAGRLGPSLRPDGATVTTSYAGTIPAALTWVGPVDGSVEVSIDGLGQVTAQKVDAAQLAFDYDVAGLLTGIGDLAIERDGTSGLPVRATLGATSTTSTYDDDGLLVRATTTVGGSVVLERRYERDALRRIAAITETRTDGRPIRTEYGYDGGGRLVSVRRNDAQVERDRYDPAGNRTSVTTPSGTVAAAYDDRDRLGVGAPPVRLCADGTWRAGPTERARPPSRSTTSATSGR